jgi:hypothetical protein
MNSYIILPHSLVVVTGGKQYTASDTHASYAAILEAIKTDNWEIIPSLMDVASHINKLGRDKITVVNGVVMFNGDEIHNTLTVRLLEMLSQGFNVDPMIKLLENLMANPLKTAIDEFYLFIEGNKLPITEDGCIIAYKRVNDSYLDLFSHTVVNTPAHLLPGGTMEPVTTINKVTTEVVNGVTTVSMPRSMVDANRAIDCSVGLHFCSLSYLGEFHQGSGRILLLKINPRDIVSIPYDYNNTKGRCWKYEVIGELETVDNNLPTEVYTDVAVVPATVNSDEHAAYDAGYQDGRAKKDKAVAFPKIPGYAEAYESGYKDGRGKQKRKFPRII